MESRTVSANKSGLIMDCMKDNGRMMFKMGKADLSSPMGTFMTVSGKTVNSMAVEKWHMMMVLHILEIGSREKSMEKVSKEEVMVLDMKGNFIF